MSMRQTKVFVIMEAGTPLLAFRQEEAAQDFCHSANAESRKRATDDPKQRPRWTTFVELDLRATPKAGRL
jgi:hypothetical protein